jgi:hypothetical protein
MKQVGGKERLAWLSLAPGERKFVALHALPGQQDGRSFESFFAISSLIVWVPALPEGKAIRARFSLRRSVNSSFRLRLALNFPAISPMLRMQTNLSAWFAVGLPAGGGMSGLSAHFLFGSNFLQILW